jgi:hypothetical protein
MKKELAIGGMILALLFLPLGKAAFAATKPAPKIDCTQKKNAGKLECKAPPKSDVKPGVKKPPKVERKAPPAVQKKAAENTK